MSSSHFLEAESVTPPPEESESMENINTKKDQTQIDERENEVKKEKEKNKEVTQILPSVAVVGEKIEEIEVDEKGKLLKETIEEAKEVVGPLECVPISVASYTSVATSASIASSTTTPVEVAIVQMQPEIVSLAEEKDIKVTEKPQIEEKNKTFLDHLIERQLRRPMSSVVIHKNSEHQLDSVWSENPEFYPKMHTHTTSDLEGNKSGKKSKPDFYREIFLSRYTKLCSDREDRNDEIDLDVCSIEKDNDAVTLAPTLVKTAYHLSTEDVAKKIRYFFFMLKQQSQKEESEKIEEEEEECSFESFANTNNIISNPKFGLLKHVWQVLTDHRLSSATFEKHSDEELIIPTSLVKNANRLRAALLPIVLDNDRNLGKWLNWFLLEKLPEPLLVSYLDLVKSLRSVAQSLVEFLCIRNAEFQEVSQLIHGFFIQKPFSPVECSFQCNMKSMNKCFVFLLVHPIVQITGERLMAKRHDYFFKVLFPLLGRCEEVKFSLRSRQYTVADTANFMLTTLKEKLIEVKRNNRDSAIFLVGWDTSCLLNCKVALEVPVAGVINLAFSNATLTGLRGDVDDDILSLHCPSLFVVGQFSSSTSFDDLQALRDIMKENSGLIVVGGADHQLRLSYKKLGMEQLTQKMAERAILDLVIDFIQYVFAKPKDLIKCEDEKDINRKRTFEAVMQLKHKLQEKQKSNLAHYVQSKIQESIQQKRKSDVQTTTARKKIPEPAQKRKAQDNVPRAPPAKAAHIYQKRRGDGATVQRMYPISPKAPAPSRAIAGLPQPPQLTPSVATPRKSKTTPPPMVPQLSKTVSDRPSDHTMCYQRNVPNRSGTIANIRPRSIRPEMAPPPRRPNPYVRHFPVNMSYGNRIDHPFSRPRNPAHFYLVQGEPAYTRQPATIKMMRPQIPFSMGRSEQQSSVIYNDYGTMTSRSKPPNAPSSAVQLTYRRPTGPLLSKPPSPTETDRPHLAMPRVNSNRLQENKF